MTYDFTGDEDDPFGMHTTAPAKPVSRRMKREILRSDEEGEFAPPRKPYKCQSRAGRWRTYHTPDKDGRCVICSKRVA